jgi:hypothetical protein
VSQQYWVSCLNPGAPWQTASGTALSTAAKATISPQGAGGTGDDPLIPAYYFTQGLIIRVKARGIYTVGSTATNGTFAIYTGAAGSGSDGTSGTALATTGALALPTSVTNLWWRLDAYVQVRAIAQGTGTNTVYTHGELLLQTATPSGTTGNVQVWPMPATAGPAASSVDTTIAHTLLLGGTLSQATGSPSITCTQFTLESVC